MHCPICRKEIKDNSKFCSKCGKIIPRCPSCGNVIEKKVRFCVYDGVELPEELTEMLPEIIRSNGNFPKKKRRLWIPILACVMIVLLIGASILGYILYSSKKADSGIDKIESSETEKIEEIEEIQEVHIYGDDKSDTSMVIADLLKESWKIDKFDNMIVVDKNGTSAAFNAGYLSKENKAPILLIDQDEPDGIVNYIDQNLKANGKLYVLGSVNSMIEKLKEKFPNVEHVLLCGQDRYETNAMVLQQTDISNQKILVCSNRDYLVGACASATGNPVLLVGGTLTEKQKELLLDNSCEIICVGYDYDFSTEVIEELKVYDGVIDFIGGDNAYDISINIAKHFFDMPESLVILYEDNPTNGLCGIPLSFEYNAPFIILSDKDLQSAAEYIKNNAIKTCYILENSDPVTDVNEVQSKEDDVLSVTEDLVQKITATSYLIEGQYNLEHVPEFAMDGDLKTAWVEGVEGQGMGETITFDFKEECKINGIVIYAGYQKSTSLYEKNSRPAMINITFSDGSMKELKLQDIMEVQKLLFEQPKIAKSISVTISDVYEGDTYADTSISEISFF